MLGESDSRDHGTDEKNEGRGHDRALDPDLQSFGSREESRQDDHSFSPSSEPRICSEVLVHSSLEAGRQMGRHPLLVSSSTAEQCLSAALPSQLLIAFPKQRWFGRPGTRYLTGGIMVLPPALMLRDTNFPFCSFPFPGCS